MRSRLYKHVVPLCCVVVLFSSCGASDFLGIGTLTPSVSTPTPEVQPISSSHRPFRVVQVCLDTPPFYPALDFHQAANKIADWIEEDVTINQAGYIVYFGEITSRSFQTDLIPPIQVQAFPADKPMPTPLPTYIAKPQDNPYQVADKQATVDATNSQMYSDWQNRTRLLHSDVAAALAVVKQKTQKLRTLQPIYDNKASDVFGCLQDASQHFHSSSGENYLIIVSALINNTSVNWTPDLNLFHAHVYGIWRECPSAPVCAEHDKMWKEIFVRFGADPDVTFYPPDQSELLSPLF